MKMEFLNNENDSSGDYENLTIPEVKEETVKTCGNLLTKERYEYAYNQFMNWRLKNKINSFSENVLLTYFGELGAKYKSSTLWSIYSMVRGKLVEKHNVNIATYYKLRALLKKKSVNYVAKKANVLTNNDIKTFIETAPNEVYLLTKTVLIFGVCGCMKKTEIYNVKQGDIRDVNAALIVDVPYSRTNKKRKFIITDNFYNICKEYINLRPLEMIDKNQKFFINYQRGKCTKQVVGINKIGKFVQNIAKFLKLPHPETYTGHTYRRTSATFIDDQIGENHGEWQSSGISKKIAISRHIVGDIRPTSDTKPSPLCVILSSHETIEDYVNGSNCKIIESSNHIVEAPAPTSDSQSVPDDHCESSLTKRWTSLEAINGRAIKKSSTALNGQAKSIKLEEEMPFLQRYTNEDHISSADDNIEEENDENRDEESFIKIEEEEICNIPSPSRSSSRNSSTTRQTFNETNTKDMSVASFVMSGDVNKSGSHKERVNQSFFNSMCSIVQGLPDYQQAVVRSQVAKIVLDADLKFQTEVQIKREN